jgi:hypothetical protein
MGPPGTRRACTGPSRASSSSSAATRTGGRPCCTSTRRASSPGSLASCAMLTHAQGGAQLLHPRERNGDLYIRPQRDRVRILSSRAPSFFPAPLHPHLPIPCACLGAFAPTRAQYRRCASRAASPTSARPANAQSTRSRQLALRCLGVVRAFLRAARLSFAGDGCAETLNMRSSDTGARARFTSNIFSSASLGSSASAIRVLYCDSPGMIMPLYGSCPGRQACPHCDGPANALRAGEVIGRCDDRTWIRSLRNPRWALADST